MVKGVLCPGAGTFAGTSIADLMFIVTFDHVLKQLDSRCAAAGLTSEVNTAGAPAHFNLPLCPVTCTA
eukprot:6591492-Karenia_brevis.AAC.1